VSTPDHLREIPSAGTAFGRARFFVGNRFVYLVISQRARGLSIGVNMNPNRVCNFKCVYCEVDRSKLALDWLVDIRTMVAELKTMLVLAKKGEVRHLAGFSHFPPELLELKEVALSGDGEPSLSPQFRQIVKAVVKLRSRAGVPFFKIVLITNTAGLPLPEVQEGLDFLGSQDEIWVKLEAGTQEYMDKINVPDLKLSTVMSNILTVATKRQVVIQSLFPLFCGEEPSEEEIAQYVQRLQELKVAGAQITLVQIYSAHRPPHLPDCGHLRLARLSRIAREVRSATGLRAEVF